MSVILCPVKEKVIGGHMHRSGWPYVLRSLNPLFGDAAQVVFDDFLEKTICNKRVGSRRHVHTEPWIGICHYPHNTPFWYETEHLRDLSHQDSWGESLANLRFCVALSEELASWIRAHWGVPCTSLKHPTEIPNVKWSKERFFKNKKSLLLQVGWYLRNTHAIFQVDTPSFLKKAWLRSRRAIAEINHALCGIHFRPKRVYKGTVTKIEPVTNNIYDCLLSQNVVFVELIASVANNTVIECIARNTPIVVNRLPGPKYYLGNEYPLFYDDFRELKELITIDNIIAAHEYMKSVNKEWLSGSVFRDSLLKECIKHVPSFSQGSIESLSCEFLGCRGESTARKVQNKDVHRNM